MRGIGKKKMKGVGRRKDGEEREVGQGGRKKNEEGDMERRGENLKGDGEGEEIKELDGGEDEKIVLERSFVLSYANTTY